MTDPRYDDPTAPLVPRISPSDSTDDVEALRTELAEMRTQLARIERALEGEVR